MFSNYMLYEYQFEREIRRKIFVHGYYNIDGKMSDHVFVEARF